MGTNYYHRFNHCDCCGRYDERHIGKSHVMFQGFRPDPDWPEVETPTLTSWREWRLALRSDGSVWDEYGKEIGVEEFIADVESTERAQRRRQDDWVQAHGTDKSRDWIDADGFSFYAGEFS